MALFLRITAVFIFCIASIAMLFSAFLSSAISDNRLIELDFFSDYITQSDDIYFQYLSDRESFYTSIHSQDIEYREEWSEWIFTIGDTLKVMTSLYDPQKKYSIHWPRFRIEQHGIWQIFIDSETLESSVFIMPITTWITLSFLSSTDEDVFNAIFLYPWQYITFQPRRIDSFRSADLARMQILTDIWHISYIEDNPEKITRFIGPESMYNAILKHLEYKNQYYTERMLDILNIEIDLSKSFSFIERNFDIFFNPEKRKVYYKNLSIKSYLDLLKSKESEHINQSVGNRGDAGIRSVVSNLTRLKNHDYDSYVWVKDMIIDYNSIFLRSNNSEHTLLKQSLIMVENEVLLDERRKLFLMFYTYINAVYGAAWKSSLQSAGNYFNLFYEVNKDDRRALQYFTLHLEEKLKESLRNPSEYIIWSILLYLREYMHFSQSAFNNTNIETRTLLFVYQDIMSLWETYLRNNFFLPHRTWTNLLVRNSLSLSAWEFVQLRNHIAELRNFFDTHTALLNPTIIRERELLEWVQNTYVLLEEYLSALENYEIYTLEYDSVSRELRELWVRENQAWIITEEEVKRYLSRFQWFGLTDMQVRITDDSRVILERMSISWRSLSFTLEPLRWNWISEISLDWTALNFGYPLDVIEQEWEERYRTATESERERYDFRRFFLITLVEGRQTNLRWELVQVEDVAQEDRVITVFKRDRLLSRDGEFSIFEGINFNFSNTIVERIDDTFRIYLDDIEFTISHGSSNRTESFEWFIAWEYVLTSTESLFRDMKLQFYVDKERSLRTRFWQNQIQILWDVERDNFTEVLSAIFDESRNIFSLYDQISSTFSLIEVVLQYNPRNNNFTIRFDFWWERHSITYANWNIQSYIRWRERIISSPTSVSDLSQYLK